jgi:hypothetical protein
MEDEAPTTPMTDEQLRRLLRPAVGGRSTSSHSASAVRFTSSAAPASPTRPPRGLVDPERAALSGDELRRVLRELLEQQTRDDTRRLEELMSKQTASILDAIHSKSLTSPSDARFRSELHRSNSKQQEVDLDLGITEELDLDLGLTPGANTIGKATPGFRRKPNTQLWRERVQHFQEATASNPLSRNVRSLARLTEWFQARLEWWENFPEESDEKHRWVDRVVRSQTFGIIAGLVIAVHTAIVTYGINILCDSYGKGDYSGLPPQHFIMEAVFTSFYAVELLLRIWSSDIYFILGEHSLWNLFDLGIVLVSIFSLVAEPGEMSGRLAFLRSLRILRVVMMARMFRLVRFMGVGSLHLMVKCMLGTLTTLGWCIVMLCFITFMFSVFFVQAVVDGLLEYEGGDPVDDQLKSQVLERFGSVQKGMLTLIMSITGGIDWSQAWEPLELSGVSGQGLFLFYILFSYIALWNIITSIFVEKALYYAKPDAEARLLKARREELSRANELHELFSRMDIDCSKTISFKEFADFVAKNEFWAFLKEKGIDPLTAHTFFDMLLDRSAQDDDQLDIDAMVTACLHVEGPASSMDVQLLRYELKDMKRRLGPPQARGSIRRRKSFESSGEINGVEPHN